MTIQPASVRLDREGFNLMPSREDVVGALGTPTYDVVDFTGDEGWTNAYDLLVLRYRSDDLDGLLRGITTLISADEIDYRISGDHVFVRFWWD